MDGKRTNAGYEIINAVPIKDSGEVVLGYNEADNVYVTWDYFNKSYFHGHYFDEEEAATRDFYERVLATFNRNSKNKPVLEAMPYDEASDFKIYRTINGQRYSIPLSSEELSLAGEAMWREQMIMYTRLVADDEEITLSDETLKKIGSEYAESYTLDDLLNLYDLTDEHDEMVEALREKVIDKSLQGRDEEAAERE